MKYLYESHFGGLYTSDRKLDFRDLYCEQCGDSDWLIGPFETIQQFWSLIKDDCSINGSSGWSLQYIYPLVVEIFDLNDAIECEDGFCRNSDEEIISRIEELIEENK